MKLFWLLAFLFVGFFTLAVYFDVQEKQKMEKFTVQQSEEYCLDMYGGSEMRAVPAHCLKYFLK